MRNLKRALSLAIAFMLVFTLAFPLSSEAKTLESAKGENIFFYAHNADGKNVLLKIAALTELEPLAHGQLSAITSGADTGKNYYISSTDNYPTTQYAEGQGFTIMELVDYIKRTSTVLGASAITYTGEDTMRFMATDSYGSYNRAWTYNELYGVKRYYFEGIYNPISGWKTGWETTGEDNSKFGVSLDDYNSKYKDSDPFYANKRAAFATGAETAAIIATQSYSGRTTTDSLTASTEPGIATYIAANNGVTAGCLGSALSDEHSLRLIIPMTEADLMAAHRTAYDNFKWIYNMRLDMANAPSIKSQGTVSEPIPSVSRFGDTLTISISCATQGAQIFYSYDGAPQIPYTQPLKIDISGRDLSSSPVTFYMTAVREGWDDAGVITAKYPGLAPAFETLYSAMTAEPLTFKAADGVSAADWTAWTAALNFITMRTPAISGYLTVDARNYSIDNAAKTITFDKALFTSTGQYSFIFHAAQYANKSANVALKKAAPTISAADSYVFGGDILLMFDDTEYGDGLSVYIKPDGENQTLISTMYLDRSAIGQVTIKSEYFMRDFCPVKGVGEYTIILTNSRYAPESQTTQITLTSGFTDVPPDAWYYDAVSYTVEAGLFNGTSATAFSPNGGMTRAMFVTVLGRMAGINTDMYTESGFSDAAADAWYGPYVAWAADSGIVTGVGGGRFAPNDFLTREQLVTIMHRYTNSAPADESALTAFHDADNISSWARNAFAWAVSVKVINGSNGRLLPVDTVTRAQAAQITLNYSQIAH